MLYGSLIKKILRKEKAKGIIGLSLVSKQKIRQLNKRFRKKDKATDVLSFYMGEDGIIGDVIIAPEVVRENARQYKVSYRQELKRMVVHGVLHLLGYKHGRQMRYAEEIYQKL